MAPLEIDEATAQALEQLSPYGPVGGKTAADSLRHLVRVEQYRRGAPEPSGAYSVFALTQGALLKEEYDLSTHAHHPGWELGALLVDVKSLILVNQQHGFPAGDALLGNLVLRLQAEFPRGKVVRMHGDGYAVLLPPSSECSVFGLELPALSARLVEALTPKVDLTLGLLSLVIEQPSHWQVLGPLVWAEAERALVLAQRGQVSGVQRRRLQLSGFLPPTQE